VSGRERERVREKDRKKGRESKHERGLDGVCATSKQEWFRATRERERNRERKRERARGLVSEKG